MTPILAVRALRPGTVVRHDRYSGTEVLAARKADGSGWWLTNGGGLRDDVFARWWSVASPPTDPHSLCSPPSPTPHERPRMPDPLLICPCGDPITAADNPDLVSVLEYQSETRTVWHADCYAVSRDPRAGVEAAKRGRKIHSLKRERRVLREALSEAKRALDRAPAPRIPVDVDWGPNGTVKAVSVNGTTFVRAEAKAAMERLVASNPPGWTPSDGLVSIPTFLTPTPFPEVTVERGRCATCSRPIERAGRRMGEEEVGFWRHLEGPCASCGTHHTIMEGCSRG